MPVIVRLCTRLRLCVCAVVCARTRVSARTSARSSALMLSFPHRRDPADAPLNALMHEMPQMRH